MPKTSTGKKEKEKDKEGGKDKVFIPELTQFSFLRDLLCVSFTQECKGKSDYFGCI